MLADLPFRNCLADESPTNKTRFVNAAPSHRILSAQARRNFPNRGGAGVLVCWFELAPDIGTFSLVESAVGSIASRQWSVRDSVHRLEKSHRRRLHDRSSLACDMHSESECYQKLGIQSEVALASSAASIQSTGWRKGKLRMASSMVGSGFRVRHKARYSDFRNASPANSRLCSRRGH
jgi:hypothetical protein